MDALLPVHAPASPWPARWLGAAVLAATAVAVGSALLIRPRNGQAASRDETTATHTAERACAHGVRRSAALLAGSVLADSLVEHYRGAFENPGMFAPLGVSALVMAADVGGVRPGRELAHAAAVATGTAGVGFHLYNVTRRIGGVGWLNLFYGAPVGAPAALALAGLLGFAAGRVERVPDGELVGLPADRVLAGLIASGIAGTVGEAGLLHFRGAFHNPVMWAPVTVPPLAAIALAAAALSDRTGPARALLILTALLGIGGAGFHVYGVGRHMDGWRNWSQNLLDGPPIPAPPAFTALALAGLSTLRLIEVRRG